MPRLSEVTDLMLWQEGLASLWELSREGTVFGGPEHSWCWGDEHNYSIRLQEPEEAEEDRDQYEMCSRCNHVRGAPYLLINGVLVSRDPQDNSETMPKAWDAPERPMLPQRHL